MNERRDARNRNMAHRHHQIDWPFTTFWAVVLSFTLVFWAWVIQTIRGLLHV